MEIKYLKNSEINKESWDACIKNGNSLVYGYSWYLDSMADNWDGIVVGDYQAVFPLTYRKKLGIYYLYQPFFMQQLGLFSLKEIDISIDSVLDNIPKRFKFWDIQLNGLHESSKYNFQARTTFHIDLNDSYETIKNRYSKDALKNIRKANASNWKLIKTSDYNSIIEDYKNAYASLNINIQEGDYNRLINALTIAAKKDSVIAYILVNESSERMGSAIFLKSNNAIHYILGAPTENGRKQSATHILIDLVLKENASTDNVFDFEGSEIPSVANFYKKFGVKAHSYFKLKVNKLHFPLNLLKK